MINECAFAIFAAAMIWDRRNHVLERGKSKGQEVKESRIATPRTHPGKLRAELAQKTHEEEKAWARKGFAG